VREEILHYIWKYRRFDRVDLKLVSGASLEVINPGLHNSNAGPDFFNARIAIDGQIWAGNVEIHRSSSDWFRHQHHLDEAYDSVILHVVWTYDAHVYHKDDSNIETLELRSYVAADLIANYDRLMQSKSWINCEKHFKDIDEFTLTSWLERLYFERLEQKAQPIQELLSAQRNDWEAVLFTLLLKGFGLKVNADAFESCARSIDFSIIRKLRTRQLDLEAVLFGQLGMLDAPIADSYQNTLLERYTYLKHKFQLTNSGVLPLKFSRMRPSGFPTIRLSQFATLYSKTDHLFTPLMTSHSLDAVYALLKVKTSDYWEAHYTFGKPGKRKIKPLSKAFIDLLLINVIIPMKFAFQKQTGAINSEDIMSLIQAIKPEKNAVVNGFLDLKKIAANAMMSQGFLQMKTHYCDKNACLKCPIASRLLL